MNDQRSIELIHAELDGEISAEERDELKARLDADPALQALREELRALSRTLGRVQPVEPPPGLRARILAAVRPPPRRSILASLLPNWPAPVMLRYGMAAAFGAAVAAVALQLGTLQPSGETDVRDLVGTISRYQTPAAPDQSISLDSRGISGSVATSSQGGLVVLDFDLSASRPTEIVADYSRAGLQFSGFAQFEDATARLDAGGGRIGFMQQTDHRYAVFFSPVGPESGAIELRFLADGRLIHQETLEVPAGGRK